MEPMLNDIRQHIERFESLVGSPEIDPGGPREEEFFVEIGIRLPIDYVTWAGRFATLEICNELLVNNLLSPLEVMPNQDRLAKLNDGIRSTRELVSERADVINADGTEIGPKPWIPIFPESGGLLPWGNDKNGVQYFWDARQSDPNYWTVVSYDGEWCEYETGFLAFLVNLLEGRYRGNSMFLTGWPWLPAIREFQGEGRPWHVPLKWRPYYLEYERQRAMGNLRYDEVSLQWVEQFQ